MPRLFILAGPVVLLALTAVYHLTMQMKLSTTAGAPDSSLKEAHTDYYLVVKGRVGMPLEFSGNDQNANAPVIGQALTTAATRIKGTE
jgi:hypothetical protein